MSHTVMVTGADGFIGSHLAEELVKSGEKVRAFCLYNSFGSLGWIDTLPPEIRNEMDIFMGDVRDPNGVRTAMRGQERVFHLAALIAIPFSYHSPDSYVDTNIKGTLNVLNAARELGTQRVMVTSTSEVYGTAQYVPIDEHHPFQGQSPYSATKIGADRLAESFYRSFDLPVSIVRPFNTYGPRQSGRAIIPTIITQLLAGQQLGDDGGDDGAAALARAIGVEGTHNGNRQVKAAVKAFGQAVRADLGGRVGALALERVVLVNRHILGGAVYFAGGSNHHALGAQLAGGVQHVQGALDVGIHIAVRAVVAERNGNQGSQMEHALLPAHGSTHAVGVTYIAHKDIHFIADLRGQGIDPAQGTKRVIQAESTHFLAAFYQLFGQMAADKAIGTGHHNGMGHCKNTPFYMAIPPAGQNNPIITK